MLLWPEKNDEIKKTIPEVEYKTLSRASRLVQPVCYLMKLGLNNFWRTTSIMESKEYGITMKFLKFDQYDKY